MYIDYHNYDLVIFIIEISIKRMQLAKATLTNTVSFLPKALTLLKFALSFGKILNKVQRQKRNTK